MQGQLSGRRPRAYLSTFNTTMLHLRNPWVVAFWSFAFPGCGNLVQGRNAKGLVLVVWELFVNTSAQINLSIMYSLLGNFSMAKQVIHTRWLLLYLPLYVYAMWDSYRGTVDLNQQAILADREDFALRPFLLKTFDMNFLDKRSPALSTMLSLLMPGLGHLYLHRVVTGLFFIAWTILVTYQSHALQAVQCSLTGDFAGAKAIVNMQWLMYIPSICGFALHDSYTWTVELNKLYEKEQSKFYRDKYQNPGFIMPCKV